MEYWLPHVLTEHYYQDEYNSIGVSLVMICTQTPFSGRLLIDLYRLSKIDTHRITMTRY